MNETTINKADLERYAYLKGVVKDADKEIKDISPRIKAAMEQGNVEELTSDFGKFSFSVVPVWTYPQDIVELQEKLDKMKEEAQQKGTATSIARKDLKFFPPKKSE